MRKMLAVCGLALLSSLGLRAQRAGAGAAAASLSHRQQDADRLQLRRRSLDRRPRRRRRPPPDVRRRHRSLPSFLSRRLADRLHRRIRRQSRRLRRSRHRRRSQAPHLPPGRRLRSSAGRPTAKHVLFTSWANSFCTSRSSSTPCRVDGGFPTQAAASHRRGRIVLAGRTHVAYVPHRASGSRPGSATAAARRRRSGSPTSGDSSIDEDPARQLQRQPSMWVGDTVYFLSDRNGPVSLFAYDTKTKQVTEALHSDGLDFKSASAGPDAIVIEQFGAIKLYDLATSSGEERDHPRRRRRRRRPAALRQGRPETHSRTSAISPTGARAVFEAWGEIFTVPTDKGDIRNLTRSPAVADRDPSWSPDGKSHRLLLG